MSDKTSRNNDTPDEGSSRTRHGTRVVTAHLPVDLAEELDDFAYRIERPRGWVIKEALGVYLAEEAEKDRLTRIALASVDAGDVIPHEAVAKELEALEAEFARRATEMEKG